MPGQTNFSHEEIEEFEVLSLMARGRTAFEARQEIAIKKSVQEMIKSSLEIELVDLMDEIREQEDQIRKEHETARQPRTIDSDWNPSQYKDET